MKQKVMLASPQNLKDMPPPEWILKGLIQRDSTALLYGPPGLGKSFLALEIAFAVSTQRSAIFTVNAGGPVVYILGEGLSGIGARILAWEEDREIELTDLPLFVGVPVQLENKRARLALIAAVKEALSVPPILIIFDTLARCAVGMDENSARDMGMVVDGVEQIREALGSTILLVHHSTKASPKTERGSGAIYGAVDTALSLQADGKKYLRLQCQKQKNGEVAPTRTLELKAIGDISCVIRADKEAKAETAKEKFIRAVTCGEKLGLTKTQLFTFAYPPIPFDLHEDAPILAVVDPGGSRCFLEPVTKDDPDLKVWLGGPKDDLAYLCYPHGIDFDKREEVMRERKAGKLKQLLSDEELIYWFNAIDMKAANQTEVADWYGIGRTTLRKRYLKWRETSGLPSVV